MTSLRQACGVAPREPRAVEEGFWWPSPEASAPWVAERVPGVLAAGAGVREGSCFRGVRSPVSRLWASARRPGASASPHLPGDLESHAMTLSLCSYKWLPSHMSGALVAPMT